MTIKPVADLYLITYEDGKPYQYTRDANEAIDAIGGGFKVEEFVSLESHRAAMLQGAEPVTTAYKLPFEQWLSQQTGTIDVECGCVMTEVFFHWLRVAYEAGGSPVIQDGWVMVPVEPTVEMIAAAMLSDDVLFDTEDDTMFRVQHGVIWRTMLAAAPQQEVK